MFDHKHYVPILRWKQAEWLGLGNLRDDDSSRITPLVEITPRSIAPRRRRPALDQMLTKNVDDMRENWGRRRLFVDLCHLPPTLRVSNGLHPLAFLATEARSRGVHLIPVTGLQRDGQYQRTVATVTAVDGAGVCVRLLRSDLSRTTLRTELERILSQLRLQPSDVDLLVDYQIVDETSQRYAGLCSTLPHLLDWRTFTVASGAFPRDLQGFRVGENLLPRLDWQMWRSQVANRPLPRRPTYGDYTIQYASYCEPPERPNFSASIRYTAENDWLIMRGEGVFHEGSPGFGQWPANAQMLCARAEFCGPDFSYGDRYIHQMSLQTRQTGSAETWLRAGINHHMTFVRSPVYSALQLATHSSPKQIKLSHLDKSSID